MKITVSALSSLCAVAGLAFSVAAQTAAAPEIVVPASNEPSGIHNLVGQKFEGWVVPAKSWTNTPQPIWLGGLQGQITVIEFFRINCSHCQDAAPSRRALYNKYRGRGLNMVGFQSPGDTKNPGNSENDWNKVKLKIKEWNLTYPIAFDEDRTFFDENNLAFYPTVLVLDKKGVVRFQQTGYTPAKVRELDEFVGRMLKAD